LGDEHITLNPSQRQHLLITCKHIDKLLGDVESTLNSAASKTVFPNYVNDVTPVQRKTIEDYIARVRGQLLQVLAGQSLAPEKPRVSTIHSIHVNLTFVDIAIAELAPHYMRGYGPISEEGAADLNGIVSELQSAIKELTRYVLQPNTGDLRQRIEKLAREGWDVETLRTLSEIADRHGLTEFRATLGMLLDRAEGTALEIAVFGRVSTGKSSLLNHVIGAELLPVGVTPITAVPTRIGYGNKPVVKVWQEGVGISEHTVEELPSFVDERLNPENRKRVGGILLLSPSDRLREGVVFIDTPGLGSLATSGAAETLAYLPRCDAGVVLVDAGSTLTLEDVATIRALTQAGTSTTVLVSKADLLSSTDLQQQIAYVKGHLQTEFETELPVLAVSIMHTHTKLLEQWFAEELLPLYERKQYVLQESLARKALMLASSVRSALEAVASYGHSDDDWRAQLKELDLELRRSAGHVQTFQSKLRQRADEILRLQSFILEKSAERIADSWDTAREVDSAEMLRHTATEVAFHVAGEVHARLSEIQQSMEQVLAKAATALNSTDVPQTEDFEVRLEMPGFHLNRATGIAVRPVSGKLGKWFQVRAAARALRPYEGGLAQALQSFSRLLNSWGMEAGSGLERHFNSFANRYRAQLERLLLVRQSPTVDFDKVERDIATLSKMLAGGAPATDSEAIAS